ncbi:hypothetical protein [Bacillus sp. FJAT-45037]|uniref:hypothetical protein n=1 Tax=Bacillus sp. FJAT-45037 TaxID=2011007 RepID=UPI000C24870B|nr:hypothetical protein [Bacillus sp. FJAT-45037]
MDQLIIIIALTAGLLFAIVKTYKKEGVRGAFIFLLAQIFSLAFYFHAFISYKLFLFAMLCGLIAVLTTCLTAKTFRRQLLMLAIVLVLYVGFNHYKYEIFPTPIYTIVDLEEKHAQLINSFNKFVPELASPAFRDISQTTYSITWIEHELSRFQTHPTRLFAPQHYVDSSEQERILKMKQERDRLTDDFIVEAMEQVYDAQPLEPMVAELPPSECMESTHIEVCSDPYRVQITLDDAHVALNRLTRHGIFNHYYLVIGEEQNYYFSHEGEYRIQGDMFDATFNDQPYRINGRLTSVY